MPRDTQEWVIFGVVTSFAWLPMAAYLAFGFEVAAHTAMVQWVLVAALAVIGAARFRNR